MSIDTIERLPAALATALGVCITTLAVALALSVTFTLEAPAAAHAQGPPYAPPYAPPPYAGLEFATYPGAVNRTVLPFASQTIPWKVSIAVPCMPKGITSRVASATGLFGSVM